MSELINSHASSCLIQINHDHSKVISDSSELYRKRIREPFMEPEAAHYSAQERLRDDRPVAIRALRPEDRADMLTAIGRASAQSLQRRFFIPKKGFSEREITFFLNVDFETHVALIAQIEEDGQPVIVGGCRYIMVQPRRAEIAFVVVDDYQGQGIGTILMRHLAVLARDAGLKE